MQQPAGNTWKKKQANQRQNIAIEQLKKMITDIVEFRDAVR